MLKSIDHVVIVVKNIEAALVFYRDVLGCTNLLQIMSCDERVPG